MSILLPFLDMFPEIFLINFGKLKNATERPCGQFPMYRNDSYHLTLLCLVLKLAVTTSMMDDRKPKILAQDGHHSFTRERSRHSQRQRLRQGVSW